MKFGFFQHPSKAFNFMYKDVLNVFKRQETFPQMIFYCKPYFKNVFDRNKNQISYNETISKPTFLIGGEKEKEIFLNGEVAEIKKVSGFTGVG